MEEMMEEEKAIEDEARVDGGELGDVVASVPVIKTLPWTRGKGKRVADARDESISPAS